jgi:nicotinamidase-related amidase
MNSTNQHEKSVLLVMDAQVATLQTIPNLEPILHNISNVIHEARANGIPIILVKVGFRSGYHEVHANNTVFSGIKETGSLFLENHASGDWHPDLPSEKNDIVVTKKRISAFAGSDLAILLRSLKAETLIITGFWTSGVVLSTVCEAFDMDYKITVIANCCGDADEETHNFLVNKILPMRATIAEADNWNTLTD